jgi:hypothetical protein
VMLRALSGKRPLAHQATSDFQMDSPPMAPDSACAALEPQH